MLLKLSHRYRFSCHLQSLSNQWMRKKLPWTCHVVHMSRRATATLSIVETRRSVIKASNWIAGRHQACRLRKEQNRSGKKDLKSQIQRLLPTVKYKLELNQIKEGGLEDDISYIRKAASEKKPAALLLLDQIRNFQKINLVRGDNSPLCCSQALVNKGL